jgi:aspartate/methionine/tyrosine aminotransferase
MPLHDWTVSNPTACGFAYPASEILSALSSPASLRYDPDPMGDLSAREAVAAWYERQGIALRPDRLLLTAGSSEAYALLFRLLCNADEEVLIPKPGYPLFEDIARLNDVTLLHYRLRYDGVWHLDRADFLSAPSRQTRAIVVVHPNNPTGSYLSAEEMSSVVSLASHNGLPIIADEVFFSFPFESSTRVRSFCTAEAPLVFVINGLSKLVALPQMKLGWIAVGGTDQHLIDEALNRLEMMADTYLAVSTPVQVAAPRFLSACEDLAAEIRGRVARNHKTLIRAFEGTQASVLHVEAGWNAILRLPAVRSDEEWALELLRVSGLLVHPGHFFELEPEALVVVSLLPPESLLTEYAGMVLAFLEGNSR